jgi:hypothetical protein
MKDISLTMKKNIFTSDVSQLNDKQAIAQKILTILNLSPGDVIYKDYLYSGMKALLGENVSNVNASIMKEQINLILMNFVPEVEMLDAMIVPDQDNQSYKIKLYYIINNNTEEIEQTIVLKTSN